MSARSSGSVGSSSRGFDSGKAQKIVVDRGRRAGRASAGMRTVNEPFEQTVRRQAIGAMQPAGGDFAGSPQARERGAPLDGQP